MTKTEIIRQNVLDELREYQKFHGGNNATWDFCINSLSVVSKDVDSPKRFEFLQDMEDDGLITFDVDRFDDGTLHLLCLPASTD